MPDAGGAPPILRVRGLEVVYGEAVRALRGVDLTVPTASVVAVLGANGAGKTTVLRAVTGLLRLHQGRITGGGVEIDGRPAAGLDPVAVVRRGVSQVMEGRRLFAELTVDENLRAGALVRRCDKAERRASYDRVMSLFPVLAGRRHQPAGYLSGGEQQMLAMGRALVQSPRLLLLDEPSLGLAPRVVERISALVGEISCQGTSVLLVEQNAVMALSVASYGYVLRRGQVEREGRAAELLGDRVIGDVYLGGGGDRRRRSPEQEPRRQATAPPA